MIRQWSLGLLVPAGLGLACGAAPNGRALELLDFRQNELDSVGLNEELLFYFSNDLERGSVTSESARILGPEGRVVAGRRVVRGNALSFLPDLPCESDLSDGGLRPGERYRVVLGGFPRPDGLRSEAGAVLSASLLLAFETAEVGKSSLFLDPFLGPYPLIPDSTELEDGLLVLECAEALDPSSVPGARFELSGFPAGAIEPELIPVQVRLIVNLRDHSELLLAPAGGALDDQRLSPGTYFLAMPGRELRTLGGRAVEPGWLQLQLRVPRALIEIDFDELGERSSDPPPGCAGTALWGDPAALRGADRGLHVRYPAAAGDGSAGAIELHEAPAGSDLEATSLSIPAGSRVDLSRTWGPVVLRSQTVLEVRGRLTRSGLGDKLDPLATDFERAAKLGEEHWDSLSAWVERLLAPGQSSAREPWTVLIAGGDIRVPEGGAIEVEGHLVLVAGGWIRVGGSVRSEGFVWKTPEGGGVASRARVEHLPLVLDPPELNPLRTALVVGALTPPLPWTPRTHGWRTLFAGHEGGGRLNARFLETAIASEVERLVSDPSELGPGSMRALVRLELPPGTGELWDPPRLERLKLEALPARWPERPRQ